jgi:hypothetical protein
MPENVSQYTFIHNARPYLGFIEMHDVLFKYKSVYFI